MRTLILSLFLTGSAVGVSALSDDYLSVDLTGATASQSHSEGNFIAANAVDGKLTGNMAGWNNGMLKDATGNAAGSNTLDPGANWWSVDFGRPLSADAISIAFEGAYSTDFLIEFFDEDPASYPLAIPARQIAAGATSTAFETEFDTTQTYRYMRLNFLGALNHTWGIKFYEVGLYRNIAGDEVSSVMLVGDNTGSSAIVSGRPTALTARIYDNEGTYIGSTDKLTISSSSPGFVIDGNTVTATVSGRAELDVQIGSSLFSATLNVVDPISAMECLVYNDGPWKAEITGIYPQPVTHPEYLVDEVTTNAGGWADGKLGTSKTIPYGDASFTVDLKRPCNINAIKVINSGAVINGYTMEFYDTDPDASAVAVPSYKYAYLTGNTADNSVEEIYLPTTIRARYVKFVITSIVTPAWGGRIRELCFYGPGNESLKLDHVALSDNKAVVGGTSYIKVQALTPDGLVVYDNLDATFSLGNNSDAISIGDKTDLGYPVTGMAEAVVPVSFTVNPRGTETMSGSDAIIVASPLDQHVCMVNHITNKLSVAHQWNPVEPYNADNSINGVTDNSYFLSGWAAADLAMNGDRLDPHTNWWIVDLGRTANIEAIRIAWSANHASRYKIEVFGSDVRLWEDYRTDPAAADSKALYTQIVEHNDQTEAHTDLIRFDRVISDAQRIRLTMLDAATDNGIQWHEVCVLGRDNADFTITSLALVRKDVNVGETRQYSIYGLTRSGYTLGGLDGATLEIDTEKETQYTGRINLEPDGRITGVRKGITPIVLKWGKITTEAMMEVTTADWSSTVNIAREFRTSAPSTKSKNGFTLGNPLATAWSHGIKGAENENVQGLIDGDWMSWTITAEETRADEKPYVVIDLGCVFPVNEFNIHWNASGDGEGNGSYIMLSGNYRVYGSADGETWADIYTVENRPATTYGTDRHAFRTGAYRYMKFEFTSPKTYGQPIAINEITIGGPEFYNAETDTYRDYPESRVLKVTTPSFDRSNAADRQTDNDWIVTSTNVNAKNPLMLSYLAVDCYGRSYLPENADVKICKVNADGSTGEEIAPLTDADGNPKRHYYRNIYWPVSVYQPAGIGRENVRAVISGDDFRPQSTDLTIYTFSERGNVNRYAYAYDNAVNYSDDWENGDRTGDRDLTFLGTAPQNAADGAYGSWYAIGYYGDGDHMGQTYKYPANTTLERPYELVMDYRGIDHASNPAADRFVKELDMIGIQFEGAFARDYNVYLLHCDDNGIVADDARWEQVAAFVNLQSMGVGQVETQRIYPAGDDGMPLLDADGRIIPWTNVAAIKIEMVTTGTQWGIKMMESAIYGTLNKTVLPLSLAQARYSDRAALRPADNGTYMSFDLALSTPFDEKSYVQSELQSLADELPAVAAYRVSVEMREFADGEFHSIPFSPSTAPTAAVYAGTPADDASVTGDGKYTFTIPAGDDHMPGDVLVKNVDPSKVYRATAIPLDKNGETIPSVDIDNSNLADLTAPAAAYVAQNLGVVAVEGTVSAPHELTTGSGSAMSLGSQDDGRKGYFSKLNKVSVNGYFESLAVTDEVAATWTVNYHTEAEIDGDSYAYDTNFGVSPDVTANIPASVDYIPLHTSRSTAGMLVDELADAPDDIKAISLETLEPEAAVTVATVNTVTYTLGAKSVSHSKEREAVSLPQADIASVFARPEPVSTSKTLFFTPDTDGDCARWDALMLHNFSIGGTPLNAFTGFYASNAEHAALDPSHPGSDFCVGGMPVEETDNVIAGYHTPGYTVADDNFSHAAATNGYLGLRLNHVSGAWYTEIESVEPIYTLLAAEYPLALAPVATDGQSASVAADAAPVLNVKGAAATATTVMSRAAGANLQVISAPSAIRTEIDVDNNLTTGVTDINAAASAVTVYPNPAHDFVTVSAPTALGTVEIYTLDGSKILGIAADASSATVDVSTLSGGIYILRAAGAATRLVKR